MTVQTKGRQETLGDSGPVHASAEAKRMMKTMRKDAILDG